MLDDAVLAQALREDLDRRVDELSRTPDAAFGVIGGAELALAALVCVALPILVVWWLG